MTIHEAGEKYNILVKILQEYERWGLCGFTNDEVEKYMKLFLLSSVCH